MPFLDTLVTINGDGSLNTKVYRKPTHTDLYLQWDGHHSIAAKYSVINTLHHRAKAVCSNNQLLKEEEDHLQEVLTRNKYPLWPLNRVKIKNKTTQAQQQRTQPNANTKGTTGNQKSYMVLPYVKGLSESIKNVGKKHGIQTYFKGGNTIKSLLMTPKDKDHITKKVVSSTDSSAKGWTVKMNTLRSHQEPLERGIKSTSRPPPQYMTTITSQVMKPALKISALWGGRIKTSSELLKKQFILG